MFIPTLPTASTCNTAVRTLLDLYGVTGTLEKESGQSIVLGVRPQGSALSFQQAVGVYKYISSDLAPQREF